MIAGIPETLLAKIPDCLGPMLKSGAVRLDPSGALRYLPGSGRHPGSLAGWIQPTGDQGNLGNILQSGLGSLQGLAAAASVVNVGVSVVGFAVVCKKLNQIQDQLKGIEHGIARIEIQLEGIQKEIKGLRSDLNEGFHDLKKEIEAWFHLDLVAQFNAILTDSGARYSDDRGDRLRTIFDKALHVASHKIRQRRFETAYAFLLLAVNVAGFLLHLQTASGQAQQAVQWTHDPRVLPALEGLEAELTWGFLSRRPSLMKELAPDSVLEGALGGIYRLRGIPWGDRVALAERSYSWGEGIRGRTDGFGNLEVPIVLDAESGVMESVPDLMVDATWKRFLEHCHIPVDLALNLSSAIDNLHLQQEIIKTCPDAIHMEQDCSHPFQLIPTGV